MIKILKAQHFGKSASVPLKSFGIVVGKAYLVKKAENNNEIIITEVTE